MLKLTNFVIWNNFSSFHYAGTKNYLIWDQDTNFKLGAITYNAVIFASFLTGVVFNTLFSASGYRIAIKICKDCVLENNEAVEKSDNYAKTSRKVVKFWNGAFGWLCLSIYIVKNSMSRMYLELARETSTRKLYTDELQWSCEVSYSLRGSFTPIIRRSLPARLYVFITQSKK